MKKNVFRKLMLVCWLLSLVYILFFCVNSFINPVDANAPIEVVAMDETAIYSGSDHLSYYQPPTPSIFYFVKTLLPVVASLLLLDIFLCDLKHKRAGAIINVILRFICLVINIAVHEYTTNVFEISTLLLTGFLFIYCMRKYKPRSFGWSVSGIVLTTGILAIFVFMPLITFFDALRYGMPLSYFLRMLLTLLFGTVMPLLAHLLFFLDNTPGKEERARDRAERLQAAQADTIPLFTGSIGTLIILSIVTFGIYGMVWNYRMIRNMRIMARKDPACTGEFLLFTFVPFYSIFWYVTNGKAFQQSAHTRGFIVEDRSMVYLVLALLNLSIVNICLIQNDVNKIASGACPRYGSFRDQPAMIPGLSHVPQQNAAPAAPMQPIQPAATVIPPVETHSDTPAAAAESEASSLAAEHEAPTAPVIPAPKVLFKEETPVPTIVAAHMEDEASPAPTMESPQPKTSFNPIDELIELAKLLERGSITAEDFNRKKDELMAKM